VPPDADLLGRARTRAGVDRAGGEERERLLHDVATRALDVVERISASPPRIVSGYRAAQPSRDARGRVRTLSPSIEIHSRGATV
jgi:hypothetical protein